MTRAEFGTTEAAEARFRGGVRELLFPRSAAIVGASDRRAESIRNALRGAIPVWGVNPNRTEVLGIPCHPSVFELPETPELAVLLVGHGRVEQAFEEAAAAGVHAFVLPGLGNEAGKEGKPIAERIAARAAAVGCSIVGPNCMGVAVPGGFSSWIGTLAETVVPGHVAALVQ